MPTYGYRCESCGDETEIFQSMKDEPLTRCAKCGKKTLKRMIGTGAGIIFKGSGFYCTDYRSKSYTQAAKKASPETSSSTSTESASGPSAPKKAETAPAASTAKTSAAGEA